MEMKTRPPRVYITYEAEIEPVTEVVELPFVAGVLADLSGQPEEPLPPLKDRKFVQVGRDGFDTFMENISPRVTFAVDNKLAESGAGMEVNLSFRSMADFEPEGIARQVPGLTEMFAAGNPAASFQMDEILHAPEFQRLEAAWRGLHYLLRETETSDSLKIFVLNATKRELLSDFREASWSRSTLYRHVFEERFGVLRADPFSLLICDYEFENDPNDLELLEGMAQVAAAAHAPFIAGASPRMFGWHDFTEMPYRPGSSKVFDGDAYSRWRSFRKSRESHYACLVLPRMLLRLPYGDRTVPVNAFSYNELVDVEDHSKFLWGNAAYALGTRIAEAFRIYHWCAAICGVEGGGLVERLPMYWQHAKDGEAALLCPTEVGITDIPEHELTEAGFTCLLHGKNTDYAAFFNVYSCHRLEHYVEDAAAIAARTKTRLDCRLALSRFAHYLMAMLRDRFEAPRSREECERIMNDWICDYVIDDDSASWEIKARYPLRQARIEVEEIAGVPGRYRARAFLRPHFQLTDPGMPLPITVELPPPIR